MDEKLFEGVPSLADFMVLKSMPTEQLEEAGIDLEEVAKSIKEDLLKGCKKGKDCADGGCEDIIKGEDEEEDEEEVVEKSEDIEPKEEEEEEEVEKSLKKAEDEEEDEEDVVEKSEEGKGEEGVDEEEGEDEV